MKTPFVSCPWTRACKLMLVFTALPLSDTQGGPLGRALDSIRNRVDHALDKIGIGKNRERPPSRDKQGERTKEEGGTRNASPPMNDRETPPGPALRQPPTKPAGPSGGALENPDPSVTTKPRRKQQPAAASAATTGKRPQRDAGDTTAINPHNGSSSNVNDTAGGAPSVAAPGAVPIAPAAEAVFAKPVPGKPGYVYAPGGAEDVKNILDVRGSTPGQKMRDPRSGRIFLVP